MNWARPFDAQYFVIAAVSVVFPWSTCPIVPTLTCGLLRSNFSLAMLRSSLFGGEWLSCPARCDDWSLRPGLNWRPRPYQGRALPTELRRPITLSTSLERETGFEPATFSLEG